MTGLRIRPAVTVTSGAVETLIDTGHEEFAVDDSALSPRLREVVPLLDGTRDRAAVIAAFPASATADAQALLDCLDEAGVLDEVGILDEESVLDEEEAGAEEAPGIVPPGPEVVPAVVLVGVEPWAGRATTILRRAGIACARIAPGPDGSVRDELVAALERGAALIVDCADADRLDVHSVVAECCDRAGTPSLVAFLDGTQAVLGPLTQPGKPGCWWCAHRRHVATRPSQHARATADRPERQIQYRRTQPYDSRVMDWFGSTLARAVQHVLLGVEQPRVEPGADVEHASLEPGAGVEHASLEAGCVLVTDTTSLVARVHTALALPACARCGLMLDDPAAEPGRPPDPNLPGLIDSRYGIAGDLTVHPGPGPLTTAYAVGTLVLDRDGWPMRELAEMCRGVAPTPDEAVRSALGEVVERYCAALDGTGERIRSSRDHLTGEVITAEDLAGYAPSQYSTLRYARYRPGEVIAWRRGMLLDGKPVWVPDAQTRLFRPAGDTYAQVTSSGVAAGTGYPDAACRAIYELIERDAVMMAWYHAQPLPRLASTGLTAISQAVLRWLHDSGVRVSIYLPSAALPMPTVMAVGYGQRTGVSVGAASHPDFQVAADKAVRELASNCAANTLDVALLASKPPLQPQGVTSIDDHRAFYWPADRVQAFDVLDGPISPDWPGSLDGPVPSTAGVDPRGSELSDLASACERAGIRIALVDLTSGDVVAAGYSVVRALSPDLVPLWFGYGQEPRAHPRLRWPDTPPDRWPHPFC